MAASRAATAAQLAGMVVRKRQERAADMNPPLLANPTPVKHEPAGRFVAGCFPRCGEERARLISTIRAANRGDGASFLWRESSTGHRGRPEDSPDGDSCPQAVRKPRRIALPAGVVQWQNISFPS